MKRLFAAGLVVVAALAATPATAVDISGRFVDDDGNPHEPAIEAIAARQITLGCADRRYCPAGPVRRDEMASFLTRALGLTPQPSPFADTAGNPHAGAIGAIAAAGITLGCNADGTLFCPTDTVLRDQMASFLTRALRLTPQPSPFADTAGNIHAEAIGAIASARITLGCASDRYCPAGPVRRDEMASFLARALGLDPIYARMPLLDGLNPACGKDGAVCRSAVVVPYRPRYELVEGFYHVQPLAGAEETALRATATRVEITVNGVPVPLTPVEREGADGALERVFAGSHTFPVGQHQVVAQWFWNARLVQTSIVTLSVR